MRWLTGVRLGRADSLQTLVGTASKKAPRSDTRLKMGQGGDNNLAVVLQPYAPSVRCEGSGLRSLNSCKAIESFMEADETEKKFGNMSVDPEVDIDLPYGIMSCELSPSCYTYAINVDAEFNIL